MFVMYHYTVSIINQLLYHILMVKATGIKTNKEPSAFLYLNKQNYFKYVKTYMTASGDSVR